MGKRGTHAPNAVTERIGAAVMALPDDEFTYQEVTDAVRKAQPTSETPIPHRLVMRIILFKVARGIVERVAPGRFRRRRGIPFTRALPLSLVAEAVWIAQTVEPDRPFRCVPDLTGDVETLVDRPGKDLRKQVSRVLRAWHRAGHQERRGKPGCYEYRPANGLTERPVMQ